MAISNTNYHQFSGDVVRTLSDNLRFRKYREAWEENPRTHTVAPFPLHLDIETTNRCNLRCIGCARSADSWCRNGVGDMDFALFTRIIDEGAANDLCAAKLSLRGEPLLNPRIHEMVRYALSRGIDDLYLNTDGFLLNSDQ